MKSYFFLAAIFSLACPANAQGDYRASNESKLQAAKQHIQGILDEDARPKRGFYGREVKSPMWKDQAYLDCASQMIVRAIEPKDPYFEDEQELVVIVPVRAELLLVKASQEGGPEVKVVGTPSMCAFEYERWSFERKRFEKVEGFRSRVHYDEFPRWGESVINNQIDRWVAIDLDKRYVKFLTRVSVVRELPYQLGPQFPVHFRSGHTLRLLRVSNLNKAIHLAKEKSDRNSDAVGAELEADLTRMKRQVTNDSWAFDHLTDSLKKLENISPFEEIQK